MIKFALNVLAVGEFVLPAQKYIITSLPQPLKPNECDDCGIELTARLGDTEEVIKKRLEYFHKNIEPLMKKAAQHYQVRIVEAELSIDELHKTYDNPSLSHE